MLFGNLSFNLKRRIIMECYFVKFLPMPFFATLIVGHAPSSFVGKCFDF